MKRFRKLSILLSFVLVFTMLLGVVNVYALKSEVQNEKDIDPEVYKMISDYKSGKFTSINEDSDVSLDNIFKNSISEFQSINSFAQNDSEKTLKLKEGNDIICTNRIAKIVKSDVGDNRYEATQVSFYSSALEKEEQDELNGVVIYIIELLMRKSINTGMSTFN